MDKRIVCIGAGAVGATFLREFSKRSLALRFPVLVDLYDFDLVEERNVVAQEFGPSDIGLTKVEAIKPLVDHDYFLVNTHNKKVTKENICDILNPTHDNELVIVVDAVDNFDTRNLIWMTSMINNIPVLHLALSTQSVGFVNWTYGKAHDTFHLSPSKIAPESYAKLSGQTTNESLPPCELARFRPLIFNTGYCGALAMSVYYGFDSEGYLIKSLRDLSNNDELEEFNTEGWMIDFDPTLFGWSMNAVSGKFIPLVTKAMIDKYKEVERIKEELAKEVVIPNEK